MQDRFKCRAWDKKRQKYIYNIQNGAEVYDYHSGHTDYLAYNELLEADSFIKEQCTGLKDKNGKMIYEGDIFKSVYTKNTYVVVREKHFACFSYKHKNVGTMLSEGDIANYELEVVGNIHENPELMEER
ncbi:YopX family protein [Ligilactobacillus sp. LYQ135]